MSDTQHRSYEYQVGGSLRIDAPSYIERQADSELHHALLRGEFCYVFSSRQMGKSSLRLRTKRQLEHRGMRCASIDMTRIGSKNITPEQWYVGIAIDLLRGFNLLGDVDFMAWWNARQHLSFIQRFSEFLEAIVLPQVSGNLFIFVDEIDSVLSLNFAVDDFFVLIRYCYNQRAENPIYNRLNWVLFGVATPADLIRDRSRTPLNIGRSITLTGFSVTEAQPLAAGLEGKVGNPQAVLKEILAWTGGQPFLTQKLCRIVAEDRANIGAELRQFQQDENLENGEDISLDYKLPIVNQHLIDLYYHLPVLAIEKFVRSCIIDHWEAQDEPEHLKTIRDRLLRHPRSARLLELYLRVLQGSVRCDDSPEQLDLLLSGLVVRHQGYLQVFSRIYREVFSPDWVEQQRAVRPDRVGQQADQTLEAGLRAKSEFVANMSHELRTPLIAILGFSQRLMRDSSLTASQQETLTIIYDSAKQLSALVNRILDVARQEEQSAFHGTTGNLPEPLTAEMLALMPPEWVRELHQAALCTDEQQIFSLLEQIPQSHRAIALALTEIVNNFRCDSILNLTQPLLLCQTSFEGEGVWGRSPQAGEAPLHPTTD